MSRWVGWPAGLAVAMLTVAMGSCAPASDSANGHPQAADPAPTRPAPQLPRAVLSDGTAITLELALTTQEISQGLMFRPHLPDDRGMFFLFAVERVPSFWMKNTMIPLDFLFLDGHGTVLEIMENVPPCAAEPCPQYIPERAVWAVLELAGGASKRLGIQEGDQLMFLRVEGYPKHQ